MDIGIHYTYDDTNSQLDPEIIALAQRITPEDAAEFGKVYELFGQRARPITTDEVEILKRQYTAPTITVTASGDGADWDTVDDISALPVPAGDMPSITIGDVLQVNDEIVVIKTLDRSGNTIDVYERGAGESDPAAHGHEAAITVKIIGSANIEGTVDIEAMAEETDIYTNYMQLFEEKIDLTKEDSDQARKMGITGDTLREEALRRVKKDLARTAIFGVSRAGSKTVPAMTLGFLQWLAHADGLKANVAGAFTQTVLDTGLNAIREAGGSPKAIVMSIKNKTAFNTFTSADVVSQEVGDRSTGRIIEKYIADGIGSIPVVVDSDMPNDQVAIVDTTKLSKGWKVGDEMKLVDEPPVNSRQKAQTMQGKLGFFTENIGQSHYLMTGLTTS